MISIIVAMARNGAIGKDNALLCHLAEDLKYFKKITKGKTVVMGRKTWESLPVKPLKFRRNIVVTSQKDYEAEGAEICNETEELIRTLKNSDEEAFCIGGASLYGQFLPHADKLYITMLYKDFEADTFFPEFDRGQWRMTRRSPVWEKPEGDLKFCFQVLEK